MVFIKTTIESSSHKLPVYRPGHLLEVYSVKTLLGDSKYDHYFQRVKELSGFMDEHFQVYYDACIRKFAEYVQVLPYMLDGPLCGLLNDSLLRAINVLHLFQKEYPDSTVQDHYAMFTAALFCDAGSLIVNQKIFITDEKGMTLDIWQPFASSLCKLQAAEYYKIISLGTAYQRISPEVVLLLARQIMPEEGFLWIASNLPLFAEWIDALRRDTSSGGRLSHILQLYKIDDPNNLMNSLPLIAIDQHESPATFYGDAFFEWLKEGVDNGSIKVNSPDAFVHMTQWGVFVEKAGIFKQFVDLYDVPINMFAVVTQFGNLLGITQKSGYDFHHAQLYSDMPSHSARHGASGFTSPISSKQHSVRQGIMIKDARVVFNRGNVPQVSSHFKSMANAPDQLPALASKSQGFQATRQK